MALDPAVEHNAGSTEISGVSGMLLHQIIATDSSMAGQAVAAHAPRRASSRFLASGLTMLLAACPLAAGAQTITFTAIGDVPYDDSELPVLQQHCVDHNLYSPGEFMVHVGDIFSGGTPCEEFRYQQVADVLKVLSVPAFMLPGDNETKDCDDPGTAWTYWNTHFLGLESNFCSNLAVSRQTARPQNFAFVSKGVLFIGLNLVGGSNDDDVLQDDADWVEQQLTTQAPFVRAAVLFAQAGPGSGRDLFFDQFEPDALAFGKPVLFIHGDGHSWIDDYPFVAPNVRRIQVERGDDPPILVTVTTDPVPVFVIDREPFDGTTTNQAPCVNAGPDLAIGIAQQARLRGQADDDRDPGSSTLTLTWSKVSGPGTVSFSSSTSAETYATFSLTGAYVLRLRGSDGILASTDPVTVTVSTTPPANNPPVAGYDSYSTVMQQALSVSAPGVLGNDSDPNNTAISAVLVANPLHGTLSLAANGSFTYTPQAGFYGLDGFTYRASDGSLQSATTNVTLNVTPLTLTLAPLEDASGNTGTPSKTDGSNQDLRVEADVVSYRSFLKFNITGVGTSVYRAKLRLFVTNSGPDGGSLYRVSNYFPATTTAWTEETLTWQNAPVIGGTPLGSAASVDTDDWVEFDVTTAIRGDGTYSFGLQNASTNNVEYSSKEGSEPPVLVIETLPGGGGTNAVPVAADNVYTASEDAPFTVAAPGVLVNDTDANGDALSVLLTAAPTHGALTLAANGGFSYLPSANYNGPDAFSYVADDGRGGLDPATVTLTVTAVNDPPVAVDESHATNEDTPLVVPAPGLCSNDSDLDGDALTVQVGNAPAHGSLSLASNGSFTYTPNLDWNGADSFTYVVSDGRGGSDTGSVTLAIAAVEDPPRAIDDAFTTLEDQVLETMAPGLLANDVDPEGDPVTVTVVSAPARGTLVLAPNGSFTYTPNPNAHGSDVFTYELRDVNGGTDTGSVALSLTPVNDAPTAAGENHATAEDTPVSIVAPGILGNDADLDGDVLIPIVSTPPTRGIVVVQPDGGFTYTPYADANGVDGFTYSVSDGQGGTATAAVGITVSAVNDAPVAAADSYGVAEDATLVIDAPGVLGNDVDVDGDAFTVTLSAPPAHGALTLVTNGGFTYIPDADFNGSDAFTYSVSDGQGGIHAQTVTLTVSPVNDAPVAAADVLLLDEDQALVRAAPGVLGNDSDLDGDVLTVVVTSPPQHGTLVLDANGGLRYTPALDFAGTDGFTYRVTDAAGATASASATLVVRAVNDWPVATGDGWLATEDLDLAVAAPGVLGNDLDADGDALLVSIVSPPDHGTVVLGFEGDFVYTPEADWNGQDTFTYGLSDAKGGTTSGTVTLSVAAVNDPPIASSDAAAIPEDVLLVRTVPGVLGNDADIDGDVLEAVVETPPAHGTLALNANGSFTYMPGANYYGSDGFAYTLRDPSGASDAAAMNLTITAVNDPPSAASDGFVTNEDNVLTISAPGVLGNDTDIDGDPLTAAVVTPPQRGTLVLAAAGGFTYTPDRDANGSDSFTYKARDASGAEDVETVVLFVAARNDPPAAQNDAFAAVEDTPLTIAPPGVLGNDADIDGDALSASVAAPPAHGVLQVGADGAFVYTPAPQYNGGDTFTYTVRDPSGATATGSVTLTVAAVNDAPLATADAYTTNEDVALVIAGPGVLGNDTDIENDVLTSSAAAPPTHGGLTINPNGGFTYTPATHYFGPDAFTYTVRDANGATGLGTVTLTVQPVNDAPVAAADAYATDEDVALVVAIPGVLANDTDIENDVLSASIASPTVHGTLVFGTGGSFTYTPAAHYFGPDAFTYTLRDPNGGSVTGSVTLSVNAVNDVPLAGADAYATNEDFALTIAVPGVLGNDVDADGEGLTVSVTTPPAHGTLILAANGAFTYTPAPDTHGADAFVYSVRDPAGATSSGAVSISVLPLNDAPRPASDAYATDEDIVLAVSSPGVLGNDVDVDGDAITVTVATAPIHGALVLQANGAFAYTPHADYAGSDGFTYAARDPSGATAVGSVSLPVRGVNDRPVATADGYTTDEDIALVVDAPGLLGNDSDVDNEILSATVNTPPQHGALALAANGGFTYTPVPHSHGPDTFTYTLRDPAGASSTGSVTLLVREVNDAPVAVADAYATDEDASLVVPAPGILANDADVDGDPLTPTLASGPARGSVVLGADGALRYTPEPNAFGSDNFTYTIQDGRGGSHTATCSVQIRSVNDAPSVNGEVYAVDEDTLLVVASPGVLGNDTDVDGDVLRVTLVGAPAHGTLSLEATGAFVFTPERDFHGTDGWSYRVDDGKGETRDGNVVLTVQPLNDAPTAAASAYATDEDVGLTIASLGVLVGATDADGDALVASLATPAAHGAVTVSADGGFTFVPQVNFHGTDAFTIEVRDGNGGSDIETVALTVHPIQDAPSAGNDALSVDEDGVLVVEAPGLLANDLDVDGDAISLRLEAAPEHGTLRLEPNGAFTYAPSADYHGADHFTYIADDGHGGNAVGTVTLTVAPVNDAPTALDDTFGTDEDRALDLPAPGLLANDQDVDGDALTVRPGTPPLHGTLQLRAEGGFVYTPAPDAHGPDSFTYIVDDNAGGIATGTVHIQVGAIPDVPRPLADTWNGAEDSEWMIDAPGVLANDQDADGDALRAQIVRSPAHGTLLLGENGAFRYVPDADWHGSDSFDYAADDGTGRSANAQVTLMVLPVNDPPVALQDSYGLDEDMPLDIGTPGVLANDSDVDGEPLQTELQTMVAHGTLTLRSDGSFTYMPALDFHGSDGFVYTTRDAAGAFATTQVTLAIAAVNDAPLPGADDFTVTEDDTLRVDAPGLLGNDLDVEGDAMTAALVSGAAHGGVTLRRDGSFVYIPLPDYSGSDLFVYAVSDPAGAVRHGAVSLQVSRVNDAPIARSDSFFVVAGASLQPHAPGLLVNDTDADGDTLSAFVLDAPQYGQLDLHDDGSFTYTPDPGFTGTDGFTYRASDGTAMHDAAVRIGVEGRGVTYRESTTGAATFAIQVQTESALSAAAGDLYLAAISSQPLGQVMGLQGMSLQWTRVKTQCGAQGETGLELWMARGAPTPGSIAAVFAAPVEHAVLAVSRYSGADPQDPLGSVTAANTSGLDASCQDGGESARYDWFLTTLTDGGIVYRAVALRDRDHVRTDGTFLRARAASGTPQATASIEVQDRAVDAGDHTTSGSFSSPVDWAAVAVEIRSTRIDDTLRFAERLEVFPNPLRNHTLLRYMLYRRATVEMSIFDARGRLVRQLLHETRPPGRLQIDWNATTDRGHSLDSGVYFLRLRSEGHTITRKIVVVK